jgi:hypothetical protein
LRGDKVEVEPVEDTGFLLLSGFMMVEVKLIDGVLFFECRLPPSEVDGLVPAVLQFNVRQEIQGCHDVKVFLCGVLPGRVELLEPPLEAEVSELVFEPLGVGHGRVLLMTKAS